MRRRAVLGLTLTLALGLGLHGAASPTPPKGFLSEVTWFGEGPRFGGFSGIEVQPDGLSFLAVSDRGSWVRGRFLRDRGGRMVDVIAPPPQPLIGREGQPLATHRTDAEGLAVAPDGTVFVSFEGPARVLRYADLAQDAENLPSHPDFKTMSVNTSLEGLAIGPDGSLYTLPEESGAPDRPFQVYRFKDGQWRKFGTVPRWDDFRAVSLDFGPDGRVYLLERRFAGLGGFASRIRRFDLGAKGFTGGETLLQTELGTHDNLEGMAIWRDGGGGLRATLVSDNNFSIFFVTQVVEYRLPD